MIPVDQTTFGDGSDGSEPGNCFAACVASLLGRPLPEVPNFCAAGDEGRWWAALQTWLSPLGWYAIDLTWSSDPGQEIPGSVWGTGYIAEGALLIGSGPAVRGFDHSVVLRATPRGPEVVHDPHPSRAGLIRITHLSLFLPLDPGRSVS